MATSPSIVSSLEPESLARDRLFYDEYEWCASFALDEASCLRYNGDSWPRYIHSVDRLWSYRNTSALPFRRRGINHGGSWNSPIDAASSTQQRDNLLDMAKFLWDHREHCKPVLYRRWISIYTNDPEMLADLCGRSYVHGIKLRRALVCRPRDVILRKNPTHRFRTFMRARRWTETQKNTLKNWLSAQQDIRIGPALIHWFEQRWIWSRDYYWIEHDNRNFTLMLEMLHAGSIGPTLQIMSINKEQ